MADDAAGLRRLLDLLFLADVDVVHLERGVADDANEVQLLALRHVVDADDEVAFVEQMAREIRADEAGDAGDHDAFVVVHVVFP